MNQHYEESLVDKFLSEWRPNINMNNDDDTGSLGCSSEKCIDEGQDHNRHNTEWCVGRTQLHIRSVSRELSYRKQHKKTTEASGSDLLGPKSIRSLRGSSPSLLPTLHWRCQFYERGSIHVLRLLAHDVEKNPVFDFDSRKRIQLCLHGILVLNVGVAFSFEQLPFAILTLCSLPSVGHWHNVA